MVFSSYAFLFAFLPAVLGLYYLCPPRWRNAFLVPVGCAFYSWWRPDFLALLLISLLVDFWCGQRIAATTGRARRGYLVLSLAVQLSLLGYFKYANFGIANLNALLTALGIGALEWPTVVLPIGISFYTFKTMSYTIDVYRGEVRAQRSLTNFACFLTLFPEFVAGPIVRYSVLADQLERREHHLERFALGVLGFQIGLAKKVLIADRVAPLADAAFGASAAGEPLGTGAAWIGLLAYACQIYFDFSGYSDMAIGLGRMLGFEFPINFDAPYRAQSITEFWRRWHITLSTWLRDYLYISLGGNRRGRARTYVNLAATMLLGGLWHGAAWNFVAWGAWHGGLLAAERAAGKRAYWNALPAAARVAATFLLVLVGWVFFRAPTLAAAVEHLSCMVGLASAPQASSGLLPTPSALAALAVALALVFAAPTTQALLARPQPSSAGLTALTAWAGVCFAAAMCQVLAQSYSPFLYFQF